MGRRKREKVKTMMRELVTKLLLGLVVCAPAGGAEAIFDSGTLTTDSPQRVVDIDVGLGGSDRVYLVADDAGDGYSRDWAAWIEPKFVGPSGEQRLTGLEWREATTGWGRVHVGKNSGGGAIMIDGKRYADGIGVHAKSVLEYRSPW